MDHSRQSYHLIAPSDIESCPSGAWLSANKPNLPNGKYEFLHRRRHDVDLDFYNVPNAIPPPTSWDLCWEAEAEAEAQAARAQELETQGQKRKRGRGAGRVTAGEGAAPQRGASFFLQNKNREEVPDVERAEPQRGAGAAADGAAPRAPDRARIRRGASRHQKIAYTHASVHDRIYTCEHTDACTIGMHREHARSNIRINARSHIHMRTYGACTMNAAMLPEGGFYIQAQPTFTNQWCQGGTCIHQWCRGGESIPINGGPEGCLQLGQTHM